MQRYDTRVSAIASGVELNVSGLLRKSTRGVPGKSTRGTAMASEGSPMRLLSSSFCSCAMPRAERVTQLPEPKLPRVFRVHGHLRIGPGFPHLDLEVLPSLNDSSKGLERPLKAFKSPPRLIEPHGLWNTRRCWAL